jgi:hypothetical protein
MSCDLRVLVDQSAESVPPDNPSSRRDDQWFGGPKRWGLPQGPVRAVAVVMINILGQHPPQLPAADDQHPVQQLPPDGAHPPLCVGVGLWRPYRRAQHPDPLGREDRIERGGELRVPISDEPSELADAVLQALAFPTNSQLSTHDRLSGTHRVAAPAGLHRVDLERLG